MKKHYTTKKTKIRLFDDIVADQDLQLPSLEHFFGRERGMHTGMPLHVLPNQYLLFKGDTKHYFPNNTYHEGKTQREIGSSFAGAFIHKSARLKKMKSNLTTQHAQIPVPYIQGQ